MDDKRIIDLYWKRDETALSETKIKYGTYCRNVAYNILRSTEDTDECENDTYLAAWSAIPPARPDPLRAFLGRITRNIAVKRLRAQGALKRGGGDVLLPFEELSECVPDGEGMESIIDKRELAATIDAFLLSLRPADRKAFVMRYWYSNDVKDIAKALHSGESRVKMMLKRTREKLRAYLAERGIII